MFSFFKKIIIGIFSYFKDKRIVSHIRLSGIIGNVGKFKQGIDFSSQQEIIKKAFSVEKIEAVAISINSPGGSPVQSHLILEGPTLWVAYWAFALTPDSTAKEPRRVRLTLLPEFSVSA